MKQKLSFILNNSSITVEENPAKTLLDFIRIDAGLKGTKEGCREGDCGACTVLLGEIENGKLKYKSINSCLLPIGNVDGKHIVTIEGLNNDALTPVQKEFNHEGASQCGFCTPGFVNSLTGYVIENSELNKEKAKEALSGNICRCTGYASINRATENIVEKINKLSLDSTERIESLVAENILPEYFSTIKLRLSELLDNNNFNSSHTIQIGGGTDLFVQKPTSLLNENVSFIKHLALTHIDVIDDKIHIGAGVTIEQFKNSNIITKYYPMLSEQLKLFASLPIRNSATIGGNIVNASPIGDSTSIFLALDSSLELNLDGKKREIKLNNFYKGYKNIDLKENEFVEKIIFKLPSITTLFNFEKVSKRTHLDIASVNTSINIDFRNNTVHTAFISAGGVSPIPLLLEEATQFLIGKSIDNKILSKMIDIAITEISPISDIRGSSEYKTLLFTQLLKAHFIKLFPQSIIVEELL